ncbi:hypothetical protein KCV87_04805 [Actinosynnema pretiosum subsp. pretiosum]|uniref:DNA helicase n=1 Tax=Actinosynnema pretiosum subsp. pretiosum TaxID=103721 RepID=A0AA45L8S7_9PSEU|nr:putative ATP/GTP-binding protein [Actinosynnema pretiosum subsp. pretiosum]QUF05426.1 hypothetical protein KCV87_04805 [Actinosynnema pretiosum subsp. pretiosum]
MRDEAGDPLVVDWRAALSRAFYEAAPDEPFGARVRLVRAPLDRTLCVQGAPGAGKTAVGLHRLAHLLFSERDRPRGVKAMPWSSLDLALLDEAAALVG